MCHPATDARESPRQVLLGRRERAPREERQREPPQDRASPASEPPGRNRAANSGYSQHDATKLLKKQQPPRMRRLLALRACMQCSLYLRLPLESIVMPPGPLSFFSSLALRVPMALVRHSSALARSALRVASSL